MASQQNSLITVAVDGIPLGVWDTRTGGESSAEVSKYRPGGMAKQKLRSGLPEVGDVTVSREFEFDRDNDLQKRLRARAGRAPMSVSDQPLDDDGVAFGKPTVWSGRLNSVNAGDSDSNSSDGRMFELVMVAAEVV
ncbi:hypothetical protein [Nocardioides sp.]|uniref:hypothetical protein n=1 Tax=Nocardioides sp. TaxID=35761 RepID=UPI002CCC1715|nr:hypothetical protein [Nocardioides sp.]HXH77316.1 hypothetical protein [Nocardioides sp.]